MDPDHWIIPHKFSHPTRRVCRVTTTRQAGDTMHVEIVQNGKVLPQYTYGGKMFIEAPPEGDYTIRLVNRSPARRLAVLSVDGRNVIDGESAGFDGPGYVVRAWETVEIPGWRRSDSKVAKFEFKPQEDSYAAQMGDGTSNTGVIGVAMFAEKVPVWKPPVRHTTIITETYSSTMDSDLPETFACATNSVGAHMDSLDLTDSPVARSASPRSRRRLQKSSSPKLGTGYGSETAMHTTETTFDRATEKPFQVLTLQYAVRQRLVEWGVPVNPVIPEPNPFPESSSPAVPAPPGWRG